MVCSPFDFLAVARKRGDRRTAGTSPDHRRKIKCGAAKKKPRDFPGLSSFVRRNAACQLVLL
jgi:hypothetical protein